ncbi:peptidase [Jannaschia sp. LMIT008]|uniref:peptidase n=1 Tax=Jannaschia maritima TaxID=3032585 RepID=UPI00281144AA|nr:peptidase [Jannaschia sp. LMIT008]
MEPTRFAAYERRLKNIAVLLGLGSAICVVQDWQLGAMALSLPFCMIWTYCAWLHREPQLKWLNVLFAALYVYGLARYAVVMG